MQRIQANGEATSSFIEGGTHNPDGSTKLSNFAAKEQISWKGGLISFIKGMIGPGALSLPVAYKNSGLVVAPVLCSFIGILCAITMKQICNASNYLRTSYEGRQCILDYPNVAYGACENSFNCMRPHGNKLKNLTRVAIVSVQIGICTVYFVFIAAHLKQIFEYFVADSQLSLKFYIAVIYLPILFVNFIHKIKVIVVLSMMGNILLLFTFILLFQNVTNSFHKVSELPLFTSFSATMSATGPIIYSYSGHALVLPLGNKMKNSEDMVASCGVLSVGVTIVTIVFIACGLLGYITYGADARGSITLNLPDTPIYVAGKAMVLLVVYFSFVLQFYCVIDALLPIISGKFDTYFRSSKVLRSITDYSLRSFLITLTLILALVVPQLENLISLVGVSFGILLSFILPPLIESILFLPKMLAENAPKLQIFLFTVKNCIIILLGIYAMVSGLYLVFIEIISA